jgi:hypothetical protein
MGRKIRILVIAASLAAVLALAIGGVAMASSSGNSANNGTGNSFGQGNDSGGQGVCSSNVTALLGLTSAEIQAQRHQGMSLVQIAAAQNVTQEQLVQTITAERQAQVQARVTAGEITQEQADYMLQNMEQNIIRAINRTTTGKPDWAGGQGGSRGSGNGQIMAQSQGAQANGFGQSGQGTGPGNMHKWGKGSR